MVSCVSGSAGGEAERSGDLAGGAGAMDAADGSRACMNAPR